MSAAAELGTGMSRAVSWFMMGREKRAQLLVPSFVFVAAAAAAACGGTSVRETGAGGATISTNPPPVSDAGVSTNPPPIGYGGQIITNPPPVDLGGYGSGGYGNEAGATTNPPPVVACPATVPVTGSACALRAQDSVRCDYGTGDACTTTMAWCINGVWSLGGYAIDCRGFGGAAGTAGTGGTGGRGGDGPAPDPIVYCPQVVPTLGADCYKPSTLTSYRCDYAIACGTYEATCSGQWQLQFHGSPTDCVGGASAD